MKFNKKNLHFFITWLVVLLLNQILLFSDCLHIYCVLVSLPHTAIIAWFAVSLYVRKKDNDDYIDIQKRNKKHKKSNKNSKENTNTSSAGNSNTNKPPRKINNEKIQKTTQAKKYGWDDKFSHSVTKVQYPKFEFDINGWSLEKVYLPSTNTDEYINIHTGDKYNKAKIDYYGKKKLTIKEIKKNERAKKHGWDERFTHKITKVSYPRFDFDINRWSLEKVYLPSTEINEYINLYTGDKYNKSGLDYSGKKKSIAKEKHLKASARNSNKKATTKEDKEFKDLKQELKSLMKSLEKLREEKNKYIEKINEFNTQYISRLGNLIENRQDVLEKIKVEKNVENFEEYHDYVVVHSYDSLAYEEQFKPIDNKSVDNKKLLKQQVTELREKREQLEKETQEFKTSKTYSEISSIGSFDKYFDNVKNILAEEYTKLKKQLLKRDVKKKVTKTRAKKKPKLQIEKSDYSKYLLALSVPNFEKIRRYCNNLVNNHKADDMQKYLAKKGKMHKAIMYDALEQFIERIDGDTITLIDWACGQGIAASLVLDYIREKQLDIKVDKIFLIDSSDKTAVSRAKIHTEVLKQNITKVYGTVLVPCPETFEDIASIGYDEHVIHQLNSTINDNTLHLFANDEIPFDFHSWDWYDVNSDIFNGYYLCLSSKSNEIINSINDFMGKIDETITDREVKVGKFKKFEKIFKSIK